MNKIFFFIFIIVFVVSCKTNNVKSIAETKINYDKYEDVFKNNEYYNKALGFKIYFANDWSILTWYKDIDSTQKKFANYFTRDPSEVLFVGSNDARKIGVRCLCEVLSLSNESYVDKIKSAASIDESTYKVTYSKNEKIFLKNIEGIELIYETKINVKNIFVFDCLIFKISNKNYRLEFWAKKENYNNYKERIMDIFQSINFVEIEK